MQSNQNVSSQNVKLSAAIDSFHKIWITPIELLIQNYINEVSDSYYPLYTRFKCLGPDLEEAQKWEESLLKKETITNLTAQENCFLALYYFEMNYNRSKHYAEIATRLGEKHGYEILGRLHWNSPDVTKPGNLKIAKEFFLKGAKLGCNIALGFLGDITIDPLENYEKAEKFHLKSARKNNPEAIYSLIIMYSMEDTNPELISTRLNLSMTAISLGSIDALNYVCDLQDNNQIKLEKNLLDTYQFYQSIYPLQNKVSRITQDFSIEGSTLIINSIHVLKLAQKHFECFMELATRNKWERISPLLPPMIAHSILNNLFASIINIESSLNVPKTLTHLIEQYLMDESYIKLAHRSQLFQSKKINTETKSDVKLQTKISNNLLGN